MSVAAPTIAPLCRNLRRSMDVGFDCFERATAPPLSFGCRFDGKTVSEDGSAVNGWLYHARGGNPMKPVTSALLAVCVAVWVSAEVLTAAGSCESLSALKLPDTTITMAQSVAAGGFSPPTTGGGRSRHTARYPPSAAWPRRSRRPRIPTSRSKCGCRRPDGTGNTRPSATADGPARSATARWLERSRDGYATSSTDTGHTGGQRASRSAIPRSSIDYAYRSVHEMTVEGQGDRHRLLRQRAEAARTSTAARPAGGRRWSRRSDSRTTSTASSPAPPPIRRPPRRVAHLDGAGDAQG